MVKYGLLADYKKAVGHKGLKEVDTLEQRVASLEKRMDRVEIKLGLKKATKEQILCDEVDE